MSECKACGYSYGYDGTIMNPLKAIERKDRFIQIYTDHDFDIGGDGGGVGLYACPKCGTIIMNKWGM